MEQIYGKEAAKEGRQGLAQKGVQTKETRIERMLNFLVETDTFWDRQTMLETTRRVFLELMAARESGNPADAPDDDLFPDLAAHLKEESLRTRRGYRAGIPESLRPESGVDPGAELHRQHSGRVCRSRASPCPEDFRRDGQVIRQDDDVVPFEQYLTLGRLDNRWKLKEILSDEAGQRR